VSIDVSKAPCSEAGRGYNHISLVASIGARGSKQCSGCQRTNWDSCGSV
jgi:hypothetical protein